MDSLGGQGTTLTTHVQDSDAEVLPCPCPLVTVQCAHDLLDFGNAAAGLLHHEVLRDVRPVGLGNPTRVAAVLNCGEPCFGCWIVLTLGLAFELGDKVVLGGCCPGLEGGLEVKGPA